MDEGRLADKSPVDAPRMRDKPQLGYFGVDGPASKQAAEGEAAPVEELDSPVTLGVVLLQLAGDQ